MKESKFVEQNKKKWSKFDRILNLKKPDPVDLNRLFIELTDDLSYARSRYRNRSVRVYLNWMMQRIFNRLYRRKSFSTGDVREFFIDEIPFIMYTGRKYMLISFVVFLIGALIGVVSSYHDPSFSSLVLGEGYVELTLENIKSGNPMKVYDSAFSQEGFVGILVNNARIDVMIFATGLMMGILSLFFLVKNAIMVGVFQFFFYQHGGFSESVLTIWMHGTVEISTLILISGAGILGGSGWMFPGTRTRFQAFRISGLKAAKLLVAILPFTLFAALVESFLTPLDIPAGLNVLFILASLGFMIFYFVIYPIRKFKGEKDEGRYDLYLPYVKKPKVSLNSIKSSGELVIDAFYLYGGVIGKIALWVLTGTAAVLFGFLQLNSGIPFEENYRSRIEPVQLILESYPITNIGSFFSSGPVLIIAILGPVFALVSYLTIRHVTRKYYRGAELLRLHNGLSIASFLTLLLCTGVLLAPNPILQFSFLFLTIYGGSFIAFTLDRRRKEKMKGRFLVLAFSGFFKSLRVFILMFIITFFLFLIVQSPLIILLKEFFMDALGNVMISYRSQLLINLGISLFVLILLCPLFIIAGFLTYYSTVENRFSLDLEQKLKEADLA